MSKYYTLAYNGSEIEFTDEEFSKIENNNYLDIWSIFHKKCQDIFQKENPNYNFWSNDLKKNGIIHIKGNLNKTEIESLKKEWEENFQPIRIEKNQKFCKVVDKETKDAYSVVNHSVPETSFGLVNRIIASVMNEHTTEIIRDYFEAHFSISCAIFSEAFPDADPITSFRWHKDYGPSCQTHIMVYLDDAAETGGRTEFVNYDDSKRIDSTGYDPTNLESRIKNIERILKDADVISPQPAAGDILIFNATEIYHCGIHPSHKSRKVMILIIQPDFLPWAQSPNRVLFLNYPLNRDLSRENAFHPYYKEVDA